jgi:hypothetical protein
MGRWFWPVVFGVEGIVLLVSGFVGRRRRNAALHVHEAGLQLKPTRAPGMSQAVAFVLMVLGVAGLAACAWSVGRLSR